MGWWVERVVPRLTDVSLRGHEVGELRGRVCEGLEGRVLEIGFGSGLNTRWYPPAVRQVDAVEPSELAWEMSADRRLRTNVPVGRVGRDGQELIVRDGTYDAALITFTLCTIPDPAAALGEVRRVLKPGASLHFLEHGISDDPKVAAWQRRLDPLQRLVAGGCHLTRDPAILIEEAGLPVRTVEQVDIPGGPKAWTTGFLGVAAELPAEPSPPRAPPAHASGGPRMSEERAIAGAEALGLPYAVTRHGPVRSLEEAAAARGLEPRQVVKTLVVRVSEGDHRFVLVPGDREIAWPKLRALLGVNRISMPPADEAREVTGYERGTITPLGSLRALPVVADSRIEGTVSIGGGAHGVALTVDAAELLAALDATVADVTD